MRIDELKRIVRENGYKLIDDDLVIFIYGYSHGGSDKFKTEIRISKIRAKDITIETGIYCEIEEFNVIKAAVKFAETPPEDREEEQKFYLRHRWITDKDFYMYLRKTSYDDKKMSFGVINFSGNDGLKFTLKEIEEIKEKFGTDLKDFELVEVEE